MALKNDESISELGKRLLDLMQEHGFQSPKEFAKDLYSQQLIHVKTRECFNSPEKMRDNAILSIEKKIVRHIRTGLISDDSGEYILGYCKLLNCSSDYLLGLTPIKSADIEVRRICEITGLREPAVTGLIKYADCNEGNGFDPEHEAVAGWWSFILSSDLLYSIPNDLRIASEEVIEGYRLKAELLIAKWNIEHATDIAFLNSNELSSQELAEAIEQKGPHLQGMLYKVSRDLTSLLEKEIVETNKKSFEEYPEKRLQQHIRIVTEHADTEMG